MFQDEQSAGGGGGGGGEGYSYYPGGKSFDSHFVHGPVKRYISLVGAKLLFVRNISDHQEGCASTGAHPPHMEDEDTGSKQLCKEVNIGMMLMDNMTMAMTEF